MWGYKAHVLADANRDIPLVLIFSTGKDNDTRYLIPLMNKSGEQHELDTGVVIADRGYDSHRNNEFLHRRGHRACHSHTQAAKQRALRRHLHRGRRADLHGRETDGVRQDRSEDRASPVPLPSQAGATARVEYKATAPATTLTGRTRKRTSGCSAGRYAAGAQSGGASTGSGGASRGCSAAGRRRDA